MDWLRDLWTYLKLVATAYRRVPVGLFTVAAGLAFYNQFRKPTDPRILPAWIWAVIGVASLVMATFAVWRNTEGQQQVALPAWRRYERLAAKLDTVLRRTKALHKGLRPRDYESASVDYYLKHDFLWDTAMEYLDEAIENGWAMDVDRPTVQEPAKVSDVADVFRTIAARANASVGSPD